jgi:uncharacterized protein
MLHFSIYLLVGICAAIVVGFFGTGSSMVILPVLTYLLPLHIHPHALAVHMAVGTCMTSIFFSAAIVGYSHYKAGNVEWSIIKRLLPAYILAPILGAYVSHLLPALVLKAYIGIFVVFAGLSLFFKKEPSALCTKKMPATATMMGVTGLISFFSSIAGIALGLLNVPYLTHSGLELKKAIATSITAAIIYTFFGSVAYALLGLHAHHLPHWSTGYIYWPAVIGIMIPVLLISSIFVKIASKLPSKKLKRIFAVFLLLAGLNLILTTFI